VGSTNDSAIHRIALSSEEQDVEAEI
jgi:hypothetical protein